MKVDYIIQNKFSEQDFERTVYDWLSDGDYTPDDIIENIITEHNLMPFPTHLYKCEYKGSASASLGYTRDERYDVYNPNTKRYETHTRTVTDWIPHHRNVQDNVDAIIYSGDSKYVFLRSFIQNTYWSKNDLEPIDHDAARNSKLVNLYQKDLTAAWNDLGIKECYRKATNKIRKELPSSLISNFKANLDFNINNQISVVVPFWVFMYKYQNKSYYVAVDGNNPERIDGVRPENKKRKYSVIAIRWVGWLSTIYLAWIGANGFYEAYEGAEYIDLMGIGAFVVLFAALGFIVEKIVKNIKTDSKNRRQENLAKMREKKLTQNNS